MKKLILVLIVFLLTTTSWAMPIPEGCIKSEYGDYSYQSRIDPQTITNSWTLLYDKCVIIGPGTIEIYYQCPKNPCTIPVAVFLVYQGAFLGYAYLYEGRACLYLFDPESKCYIGKQLDGASAPLFKRKLGEALGMRSL